MRYFIYETINTVNGKRYRGAHSAKEEKDNYLGSGNILICAVRKYGKAKFKRELLEECPDEETMWRREAFWVDSEWVLRPDTYNLKAGGAGRVTWSEESRRAIGEKNKGRKRSQEQRMKQSERMRGHVMSEESRRKLSESKKGSRLSEETCRKIGNAKRGVVPSEETRRKLSEAAKGRIFSDEARQKIRDKATGRKASDETRQKLREDRAARRDEISEKTKRAWEELNKSSPPHSPEFIRGVRRDNLKIILDRTCIYHKTEYNKGMLIKLPTLECQKCGHRWTPRKTDVRLCPKCHTPLWDKPREKK